MQTPNPGMAYAMLMPTLTIELNICRQYIDSIENKYFMLLLQTHSMIEINYAQSLCDLWRNNAHCTITNPQ
jgi:hypothetical protein